MSSQLSSIPPYKRRQAAAVAGGSAVFLLVVGLLPWIGSAATSVRLLATVAILAGLLFGLICWGLLRSIRLDAAEVELDAVLSAAVAEAGVGCDCGHEHNPDDLTFADEPAPGSEQIKHATGGNHPRAHGAACGSTENCDHSCATCALSTLKS
ncbi:hypothetical protein [Jatrophihabitans sp. GAS493]|uniref:hypothetical protein n=1 Tax=Jatrophihabitans sp. GAS493 TaxID=1907575 RepID=UPI001F53C0D8|nr:hypothetical protein [Jatrophihabitans sp. GAS493]